jgi:pseudaminic acid cytidylyltransferase
MNIAFIPARSGSKSISHKNLVDIGGGPLLTVAIKVAVKSGVFDRIVFSTDSQQYADLALECHGLIDIHFRPPELSTDEANINDVVRHYLHISQLNTGCVGLIQPTSPFVRVADVTRALAMIENSPEADGCYNLCSVSHNFHFLNQRILEGDRIRFLFPEERSVAYNKQLKKQVYKFGNFACMRVESIVSGLSFFEGVQVCSEVIDTPFDFDLDCRLDIELGELLREQIAKDFIF